MLVILQLCVSQTSDFQCPSFYGQTLPHLYCIRLSNLGGPFPSLWLTIPGKLASRLYTKKGTEARVTGIKNTHAVYRALHFIGLHSGPRPRTQIGIIGKHSRFSIGSLWQILPFLVKSTNEPVIKNLSLTLKAIAAQQKSLDSLIKVLLDNRILLDKL